MIRRAVAFRSATDPELNRRCKRCWLLDSLCICERVPTVETQARFLVFRHAKERWKTTNSARIAALAMPSLNVVDYGVERERLLDLELIEDGAWLLFPDPDLDAPEQPDPNVQIIVPDGNWRQARRLTKKLDRQTKVRRLSFRGRTRGRGLRRTHVPENLSTLEAIAACVEIFEGPEKAETLLKLYATFVDASWAGRGK